MKPRRKRRNPQHSFINGEAGRMNQTRSEETRKIPAADGNIKRKGAKFCRAAGDRSPEVSSGFPVGGIQDSPNGTLSLSPISRVWERVAVEARGKRVARVTIVSI